MSSLPTLSAFTKDERTKAHRLLAAKVTHMMGRKFEEYDWTSVYCRAKGIPESDWSNLDADVVAEGLVLELKLLKREESTPIKDWCGTFQMHPALTRQVSLPNIEDPDEAMRKVIEEYQRVLENRRADAKKKAHGKTVEMRTGWLLYTSDLEEFLYFEEPTENLDPKLHRAEWSERGGTRRRASKNLWIFSKKGGHKVWSVTGASSGTKIQPYFMVPPADDPNLYYFRVQGEPVGDNLVRTWATEATYLGLTRALGDANCQTLSKALLETVVDKICDIELGETELVREVSLTSSAYMRLREAFHGKNDEHRLQLFLKALHANSKKSP